MSIFFYLIDYYLFVSQNIVYLDVQPYFILLYYYVLFYINFRLYINGVNLRIQDIYPKITFPVSRGTPSIQKLPFWDHNEQWTPVVTINSQVILHIQFKICLHT